MFRSSKSPVTAVTLIACAVLVRTQGSVVGLALEKFAATAALFTEGPAVAAGGTPRGPEG